MYTVQGQCVLTFSEKERKMFQHLKKQRIVRLELTSFAWKAKNLPLIYIRMIFNSFVKLTLYCSFSVLFLFFFFLFFVNEKKEEKGQKKEEKGQKTFEIAFFVIVFLIFLDRLFFLHIKLFSRMQPFLSPPGLRKKKPVREKNV